MRATAEIDRKCARVSRGSSGSRVARRPAKKPVPAITGTGFCGYGYGSEGRDPRETRADHYLSTTVGSPS